MKIRYRILLGLLLGLFILLAAGYAAAGVVVYQQLSNTIPHCQVYKDKAWLENTPAEFTASSVTDANLSSYEMPVYETIRFSSREDNIALNGWYIPAGQPDAATVILVPGLNDCKLSPYLLLPAGMLHRAGFNAFIIELRNFGDSQIVDGRFAAGTVEYRDVLGAWDWLQQEKGVPPESIGVWGMSLGAATSLMAMGKEPGIVAVWEDSSFSDMQTALEAELTRKGFPTFLASAGILMGRVMTGNDVTAYSPLQAIGTLNGRDLFITHGSGDTRLSVQYAYDLSAAAQAQGWSGKAWVAEGSEHVRAMFDYQTDYEARLVVFFTSSLN